METVNRDDAPRPGAAEEADPPRFLLRSVFDRLPKPELRLPRPPARRVALGALAVLLGLLVWRFTQASLRTVDPGSVGVCVNRFTGALAALAPGTHFRPPALYQIHPVRVSDQLLTSEQGQFQFTTREGVLARAAVQARWAVDRRQLLARWAALPPRPATELVAPVLFAAFRTAAPRYDAAKLVAEKREELAAVAAQSARARLAESGIVLKEVSIGDLVLPPEFEKGRIALVDEVQSTERLDVTLKRRAKEVEETRLAAEAQKARRIQEAEAVAAQRVIAARAEADAMRHVLALKEKQIAQRKLEAEAEKQALVARAEAAAEASRIQSKADAERRRTMADAEAYAIRSTSLAEFEGLEREAKLVSANPLLIPKTFADRLSERVQVILTPSIGGEAFTGQALARAVAGEPPVPETAAAAPLTAQARRKAEKSH